LIVNNCMLYNQKDSVYFLEARRIQKEGERLIGKYRKDIVEADDPEKGKRYQKKEITTFHPRSGQKDETKIGI